METTLAQKYPIHGFQIFKTNQLFINVQIAFPNFLNVFFSNVQMGHRKCYDPLPSAQEIGQVRE